MKYLISFILFISFLNVQSQTVSTNTSDTLKKIPFDVNRIKNPFRLSLNSDVFKHDSVSIWSDRRTLSEIMDQRPGFFINDFGFGGRNTINYNGRSSYQTGIFRDGIQVNDNFYQGFDIENFSVNEIEQIEEISAVSSFYYGLNSSSKSINVITKDIFNSQPFSQLRYSQDREGSLYADVFLSQPVSKKANVMLGLTKHSLDGRYDNSEFDVWRGRARVNLYLSPKFNARAEFNLVSFDRGLNEGLHFSANEDSLSDPLLAAVKDNGTNENLENYFYSLSLTGRLFKNKDWLTKFRAYSNNSLRELSFSTDTTVTVYPGYQHSILYGGELTQNITLNSGKHLSSNLTVGGNVYLNYFAGKVSQTDTSGASHYQNFNETYYSLKAKYDLRYRIFSAGFLLRNDNITDKNSISFGAEGTLRAIENRNVRLDLRGGYRRSDYTILNAGDLFSVGIPFSSAIINTADNYYTAGVSFWYKSAEIFFDYGKGYDVFSSADIRNMNAGINIVSENIDFILNFNNSDSKKFPEIYLKSDIAYKNILFKGKLKIKTGFISKFYNIKTTVGHNQKLYSYQITGDNFPKEDQFTVDFYVGARIGKANINLTVANIFNSLVYNTYLFPLDDRGGFLNSISRFTIVWDFIN
ncbi:MAG: TonB-dependent receptor plug domain-containing protein [Ignavibacteria bacterium]|nr:TonB-dependent receptor plug domain-containing protein [Ignavibacteria bacterium]